MKGLYWYHALFAMVYYITIMGAASDSVAYFKYTQLAYTGWFEAYDTSTKFIHFISYPFVNYFFFGYEMMMVLFAWMGYWGFIYFYIFIKENIRFKHVWQGVDLTTLILFLPNMHYWTSSLGKGSIIFLGVALATYGLSRLTARKTALILGLLIVYHVRPHIFLVLSVAIILGLVTGRQKIPMYQKLLVFAGSAVAVLLLYDKILEFGGLDSENLIGSFDETSAKRASDLSKSGSGLDISSYPFVLKLITFWYRPLFFDAPSLPGIMVSIENTFYIMLTLPLFNKKFIHFVSSGTSLVKASLVVFLGVSVAMCSTLSNLGLIIRQKTMIMYFLVFIVLSFMDYKQLRFVKRKKSPLRKVPGISFPI
ncbi:MAG: hypothetical protein H7122_21450 [Chitinophagaceae bacterium]|nr:hypothetical protein [Chitinophagaceae bacterium]